MMGNKVPPRTDCFTPSISTITFPKITFCAALIGSLISAARDLSFTMYLRVVRGMLQS